jgi:oligopeptide/dipeptide ABC transporter ATP-binding protein
MPQIFESTDNKRKTKLRVIVGDSSAIPLLFQGCVFEPRCPDRMEDCRKREPALVNLGESHTVSCFKYGG